MAVDVRSIITLLMSTAIVGYQQAIVGYQQIRNQISSAFFSQFITEVTERLKRAECNLQDGTAQYGRLLACGVLVGSQCGNACGSGGMPACVKNKKELTGTATDCNFTQLTERAEVRQSVRQSLESVLESVLQSVIWRERKVPVSHTDYNGIWPTDRC
jgi:hypothetical protein